MILLFWRDVSIINFSFVFNLTFTFSLTQYDENIVKLGLWVPVQYGETMLCQVRNFENR